jgi:hypothetical protein
MTSETTALTSLRLLVLELSQRPFCKEISAELFPKITNWKVENFVNITDSHILLLAERCKNIEKLVLIKYITLSLSVVPYTTFSILFVETLSERICLF